MDQNCVKKKIAADKQKREDTTTDNLKKKKRPNRKKMKNLTCKIWVIQFYRRVQNRILVAPINLEIITKSVFQTGTKILAEDRKTSSTK